MDENLLYDVNLCCICQNAESLELFNTTTTTNLNNRTYVEIVNNLFSDIVWIDDKSASNLCKSCSTQLDSFAEFKRLCLEINDRRRQYISKVLGIDDSDDVVLIKTEVKPELVVSTELGKSHQCPNCSESFDKKVELRRHEKKVHKSSTPGKRGPKRKAAESKKKVVVKRKVASKRPRKVKKIIESDEEDDDEDDVDFAGDVNSDGEDANKTQREKSDTDPTDSTPNLFYKPGKGETTCRICARTLSTRPILVKHIYHVHTNRTSYKCTLCDAGFKYKDYLDRHMFRHNGSRTYICTQCGAKFITSRDLRDHMMTHQDIKKYSCDKCDKRFKVSSGLRLHKIIVHTDPSDFKFACTMCDKKFPLKCALDAHIPRHTSARKIKCHVCQKEFYTKYEVKNHMLCHTNVRNFKCDLCPEEFKQKQGLEKHKSRKHQIGTVAPIKKLPCGYCGRLITSGDKLRRHERTHTGEKPFKCRLCDMRFICRSYIKGHLKGKHLIDVEVGGFDQKSYYESSAEEDIVDLRSVNLVKTVRTN